MVNALEISAEERSSNAAARAMTYTDPEVEKIMAIWDTPNDEAAITGADKTVQTGVPEAVRDVIFTNVEACVCCTTVESLKRPRPSPSSEGEPFDDGSGGDMCINPKVNALVDPQCGIPQTIVVEDEADTVFVEGCVCCDTPGNPNKPGGSIERGLSFLRQILMKLLKIKYLI